MLRKALLVIVLALLLWTPSPASAASDGIIQGVVMNGTGEGGAVPSQPLTLNVYRGEEQVDSIMARADDQGRFEFGGLTTDEGYLYKITLDYQQAQYESDWIDFSNGEATQSITMTVYEPTTDVAVVRVHTAHAIIIPQDEYVVVQEYYLFMNGTARTYVGTEGKTLQFHLPSQATDVSYDFGLMSCCVKPTPGGFDDSMALIPGTREIGFSYKVPVASASLNLKESVLYPTDSYQLLLSGDTGNINSPQLTPQESLNINGVNYRYLSGQSLSPGTELDIQLSGLAAGEASQLSLLWATLGAVVLLGGLTFGYMMRRRLVAAAPGPTRTSGSRRELLLKLAQLDDDFESGRITEAEYKKLRASTKAQLQELWLDSEEERQ